MRRLVDTVQVREPLRVAFSGASVVKIKSVSDLKALKTPTVAAVRESCKFKTNHYTLYYIYAYDEATKTLEAVNLGEDMLPNGSTPTAGMLVHKSMFTTQQQDTPAFAP